jgi:gas vesicle protein
MKKVIFLSMLMIFTLSLPVCASETTKIPEMSMEEYANMINSKQAKVEIIKKNNREVTALKEELRAKILEAANKVNNLKINVSNNSVDIPDETIRELKNLLEFLQEAKTTLESDVQKISDEIEKILDLISTKGMQLDQYDLLIEKQNTIIVKMKEILSMVNKI